MTGDDAEFVAALARWEAAQGRWRVLADTGGRVTVGLFSCDGGTEVDRVTGVAGDSLRRFLAGRVGSDD